LGAVIQLFKDEAGNDFYFMMGERCMRHSCIPTGEKRSRRDLSTYIQPRARSDFPTYRF